MKSDKYIASQILGIPQKNITPAQLFYITGTFYFAHIRLGYAFEDLFKSIKDSFIPIIKFFRNSK